MSTSGFTLLAAAVASLGVPACGSDSTNAPGAGTGDTGNVVVRTDLVSDDGAAATRDPNLVNAWGLAVNPGAPGGPFFWVSANHTGLATVYDAAGKVIPLVVNVTPGEGGEATSEPTGQVFNTTQGFDGDVFIFDGEDGKVSGWQSGGSAVVRADESAGGAIYKGLAIVGTNLWAPDFHGGAIDVFDGGYAKTAMAPTDPDIPAGYAPFNVASIDGKVYVAYAMQDDDAEDDVPGAGHGYVDVFTEAGDLDHRLVSQGSLNSPWAMTRAPAGFGAFGGALLVGNFGDGTIQAFDADSGEHLGALMTESGSQVVIPGLWDLKFVPESAALSNTLFFTAGPAGETHGLFGKLEIAK